MKRLFLFLLLVFSSFSAINAQNVKTYVSNNYGIKYYYDADLFNKQNSASPNTVLRLENLEYMVLVTINVQPNTEYMDITSSQSINMVTNMMKQFGATIVSPFKSQKVAGYTALVGTTKLTKKGRSIADTTYYFYHRGSLITMTFETLYESYAQVPNYCSALAENIELF